MLMNPTNIHICTSCSFAKRDLLTDARERNPHDEVQGVLNTSLNVIQAIGSRIDQVLSL